MTFIDLAKKRYSVRNYQTIEIEKEKLDTILQAGRVAPTAANQQPVHFIVANDQESLQKLSKGTNAHKAPLAIIVCADKNTAWVRPFDKHSMVDIDATIATDHMMMCAEDLGLSSCWLTYFEPEKICNEFNIPANLIPINILVIGYSADKAPQSPERHSKMRYPISDLVTFGSF